MNILSSTFILNFCLDLPLSFLSSATNTAQAHCLKTCQNMSCHWEISHGMLANVSFPWDVWPLGMFLRGVEVPGLGGCVILHGVLLSRLFSQELAGRTPLLSLYTKGRGANSRDLLRVYHGARGLQLVRATKPKCALSFGLQPFMLKQAEIKMSDHTSF